MYPDEPSPGLWSSNLTPERCVNTVIYARPKAGSCTSRS
jgi:hypothetical protein